MTVSHERTFEHEVPSGTEPMRVDQWVAAACREFSRSVAADDATVFLLNGKQVKKSRKVHGGDLVSVRWTEQVFERVEAQDIPCTSSTRTAMSWSSTSSRGWSYIREPAIREARWRMPWCIATASASSASRETDDEDEDTLVRPGIVHRLDKDTSGVMVIRA
jgi:23S rRNA-/tRNA-specific pseudouridylate synthase